MRSANDQLPASIFLLALLALAGCSSSGGNADADADGVPAIRGVPTDSTIVNSSYSFVPEAEDSDGDVLQFAIVNKPDWTQFDDGTGVLQGTPASGDIGTHENIIISVTDGLSVISLPSFSIRVSLTEEPEDTSGPEAASSQAPVLSGAPNPTAVVDSTYNFLPDALDPDGDALSFSIINKPRWATFDTATGRLEGRPDDADVGLTDGIDLTATDGVSVARLNQFGISVQAIGPSSFTISWAAPTENEDGTPLMDLAGYRVYYGTASRDYSEAVELNSTGMTTFTIENLSAGDYFLAMTSINSSDVESDYSQEISFGVGS